MVFIAVQPMVAYRKNYRGHKEFFSSQRWRGDDLSAWKKAYQNYIKPY